MPAPAQAKASPVTLVRQVTHQVLDQLPGLQIVLTLGHTNGKEDAKADIKFDAQFPAYEINVTDNMGKKGRFWICQDEVGFGSVKDGTFFGMFLTIGQSLYFHSDEAWNLTVTKLPWPKSE